jgi:hypothetical protein
MKLFLTALTLAVFALAISNSARAQQAITADQLVGVWKLKSMTIHNASTTGEDMVSPLSIGYLTFVREGKNLRASINFAATDRKQAQGYATDQ